MKANIKKSIIVITIVIFNAIATALASYYTPIVITGIHTYIEQKKAKEFKWDYSYNSTTDDSYMQEFLHNIRLNEYDEAVRISNLEATFGNLKRVGNKYYITNLTSQIVINQINNWILNGIAVSIEGGYILDRDSVL